MKKPYLLIIVSMLILNSCGGTKTSFQGLASESYLEFIGKPNHYPEGVEVIVDDKPSFIAKVYKDKVVRMRGEIYSIKTGRHMLKVKYQNQIIFNKEIFISTQESKKIILP
jgi:hypothetical protein